MIWESITNSFPLLQPFRQSDILKKVFQEVRVDLNILAESSSSPWPMTKLS